VLLPDELTLRQEGNTAIIVCRALGGDEQVTSVHQACQNAQVAEPDAHPRELIREDAAQDLGRVHTAIVDEWHQAIGNKRGLQIEPSIARLKHFNPGSVVREGLSATLGLIAQAMRTLVGQSTQASHSTTEIGSQEAVVELLRKSR
jgi:hypothetical protein